jgi:hypothetical protein
MKILKNLSWQVATAVLLLLPAVIFAQKQTTEQQVAAIKADVANYYWGEGFGATYSEADRMALTELISKISVSIEATISNRDSEVNGDYKSEYDISFKSYSNATLNGAQVIVVSNEPESQVFRFISKKDVEKIFEQREEKVRDYVRTAARCEEHGKIDEALRYYYWGLKLLQSLLEPNKVRLTDGGANTLLITEIPKRINEILENLQVKVLGEEDGDVDILITYKGNPVASVDYTYFDGLTWSTLYSAKDGRGLLELRQGMTADMAQLKFEYEYVGESHIDKEMNTVMLHSKAIPFRKATVSLADNSKKRPKKKEIQEAIEMTNAAASVGEAMTAVKDDKPYVEMMNKVINAIKKRDYASVRSLFTDNGWEMFDRLIHYGQAKLSGDPVLTFLPLDNRVVCRSVPMVFSFQNNNRKFMEDVTFTFSSDMKIETLAFGLGSSARTDIFDKGVGVWSEKSKMVLATFLENYKTAYALKRLDYIESIFSEDALIITGQVLKKKVGPIEGQPTLSRDEVRYTRHTKRDFIRKLERSFKSNQFINIRFSNNDVVKAGVGGEIYGIQIHQDYYSSTYGDTGYLFLMVDINDPDNPIISIRTWQPERNPDINSLYSKDNPNYGIYSIYNF